MMELYTSVHMVPFLISGLIVLMIAALEVIGLGAAGEIDADVDFDTDFDLDADLEIAFGNADVEFDVEPSGSLWSFFEFGKVPLLVQLLAITTGFTMSGFLVHGIYHWMTDSIMHGMVATVVALLPTIFFSRILTKAFSAIVPKESTEAINVKHLGGRIGMVTTGIASVDNPAMASVKDWHGNTHSIRVVPFKGEDEIPSGTEIVILRDRDSDIFQAMSLDVARNHYKTGET